MAFRNPIHSLPASAIFGPIPGSQISGPVAQATTATTAGSASSVTGPVSGSQITGPVAQATAATTANSATAVTGVGTVPYTALSVGTGNLVPDPSFEGAYAASLVGGAWSLDTPGNNSAQALKLTTTGGGFPTKKLTTIPVIPGEQYYLAVDYRVSSNWAGTNVNLNLAYRNSSGTQFAFSVASDSAPVLGGGWKRISGLFTVPANAVSADVQLQQAGSTTAGATWWDNAEVRTAVVAGAISAGIITGGMLSADAINGKTITGATLIGGLELIYSGAPAANNLIASTSATAGTDAYGNPYLAGVCTYSYNQAYTQINAGVVNVGPMTGNAPQTQYSAVMQEAVNGGLQLVGSVLPGAPFSSHHPAALVLKQGDPSVTAPTGTEPYVALADAQSTSQSVVSAHISGALIKTDVAGNVQQWQPITAGMLGTGWAVGPSAGTVQPLQYRIDGMDNLILDGAVHSTSSTPASVIFTLPTGYRPNLTRRSPGVSNSGGTATVRFCEVNSSGAVSINQNVTAASTDVYFECSIPLGNIP